MVPSRNTCHDQLVWQSFYKQGLLKLLLFGQQPYLDDLDLHVHN